MLAGLSEQQTKGNFPSGTIEPTKPSKPLSPTVHKLFHFFSQNKIHFNDMDMPKTMKTKRMQSTNNLISPSEDHVTSDWPMR